MRQAAQQFVLPALLLFGVAGEPVLSQSAAPLTTAPSGKAIDPAVAAAEAAFLKLPDVERIAIQNDLVWLGDYKGAAFGTFGRLTREAIMSLQKRLKVTPDGILTEPQRKALTRLADEARDKAGFAIKVDPATGSGIGVPGKLLTRYEKTPIGGKWQSADGSVLLETVRTTPEKADLPATFERFVTASLPGRKVTYKLLRPDFFVVTGETGPKRFYTRFAPTTDGLRGYTLTYDAAHAAQIDPIAIAIANTFEPVHTGAGPKSATVAPTAPATLAPQPAAPLERLGTALSVAAGKAVTAEKAVAGCNSLSVGGRPARIIATESGLALLDVTGLGGEAPALRGTPIASGDALIALGFDASEPQPILVAAPGEARLGAGRPTLPVALQAGGAGSLVIDRSGAVAGLVLDPPLLNRRIAGTIPLADYTLAPATTLKNVLAAHGIASTLVADGAGAAQSTGTLATTFARRLAVVLCR